jgi:hypothetical protein
LHRREEVRGFCIADAGLVLGFRLAYMIVLTACTYDLPAKFL